MTRLVDILLVLMVLTNMHLLGSSRVVSVVRGAANQGIVLGLLVLCGNAANLGPHVIFLAVGSAVLKSVVFPWFLLRAVRDTQVRREVEPFVSYTASLVAGVAFVLVGAWLSARLPLPQRAGSALAGPVAFSTVLSGLFIVIARKKAVTQVVGYLVLENGIFAFGLLFVRDTPWLVELGVLLDVFVGVFVMGVTIFNINQAFDHIETDRLVRLQDMTPGDIEETEEAPR